MLGFFRKHQRFFFFFVTIVVAISFSFFGTYSTLVPEQGTSDRVLGKAIDGSSLRSREVEGLARLIGSDHEDQGKLPNVLNDGVIGKDLLMTGLGTMLAERYFADLKDDLQPRIKKASHFKPYAHPQVSFLSAESVWQHIAPGMSDRMTLLKNYSEEMSLQTFSLLAGLYVDQMHLPPEMLRRILSYQQKQYSWVQPDPRLQKDDLSLFGFQTVEDWLGPKFVQLASQFILNAALIAEQKGYRVTEEEAHVDLLQNVASLLQRYSADEGPEEYFKQQVRVLGMDERTVLKLWRKVMLFRRYFSDVGGGVFNDDLAQKQFNAYAKESVSVDLYQLPPELRLKNFQDLLKLQVYLDAVALPKARGSLLSLPKAFLKPEDVEKRFPELVQRSFLLEFSEVQKEQIAEQISLRETWEWELEDNHWKELKTRFPILAQKEAATREERFLVLESLDPKVRLEIDQCARARIVDSHPEWIDQALQQAPLKTQIVGIRSKGGTLPFAGATDSSAILTLLQLAPLKDAKEDSAPALAAGAKLVQFSADGKTIYRVSVLKRSPSKEILTFATASHDGVLETLLDKRLEESYSEVSKKDAAPFKQEDGTLKPWKDVKDQIGARLYPELLKAIKEEPQESLDVYAHRRLYEYMKEAGRNLEADPENPLWIQTSNSETEWERVSLDSQWRLVKSRSEIKRSAPSRLNKEELFQLEEGAWSKMEISSSGDLSFAHVLHHQSGAEATPDEVSRGQYILSIDAKRYLMQQVLDAISAKNAIVMHE
jgi:GcvH upstream region-like protein